MHQVCRFLVLCVSLSVCAVFFSVLCLWLYYFMFSYVHFLFIINHGRRSPAFLDVLSRYTVLHVACYMKIKFIYGAFSNFWLNANLFIIAKWFCLFSSLILS